VHECITVFTLWILWLCSSTSELETCWYDTTYHSCMCLRDEIVAFNKCAYASASWWCHSVQILFSRLAFKELKCEMYETVLHLFCMGAKLGLRRMFENRVLKIIFGRKREDVRGGTGETAQWDVMQSLLLSSYYWGNRITENKIGVTYCIHR
jgi:hypothetical protein